MTEAADEKLKAVQAAMTDAVTTILASEDPARFAQAMRLCNMGQKISVELVSTVKGARQVRTQYGGQVNDLEVMVDPDFVGAPGYDMVLPGIGQYANPPDQTTMLRDMMMMAQQYLSDQKILHEKQFDAATKSSGKFPGISVYLELNECIRA